MASIYFGRILPERPFTIVYLPIKILLLLLKMITAEEKDMILLELIKGGAKDQIIHQKTFGLDYTYVRSIIKQFERRGFVNSHDFSGLRLRVQVEIGAHDFMQRGGFKFEEEVFRNNFTKLELELAKLEGEIPQERFINIMSLISTASAAVSAYSALK